METSLEVRVVGAVDADHSEGALDIVNVTVGNATRPGTLSISSETAAGVESVASAPANGAGEVDGHVDAPLPAQKAIDDDGTSGGPPSAAALSCISGTWGYQHPTAGYTGVPNYQVEVWDDDTSSGDDLLVEGVTSGNGNYNQCYNAADGEGSGAQEVYVRFISENSVWRVRNTAASNSNYVNATGVVSVADGANHSFGSLQPGNDVHRGIHAFHALNKVWNWGVEANNCFDHHDGVCRQMVLNWTNTSVDGTYYSGAGNDIHLAAADPDSEHLVIHEATHAVMDDVYNDSYPPSPNCNPHFIQGDSSQGCAWSEGFAEYIPAAVLDDPRFVWADGSSLDLEDRDWNSLGWDDGDDVEGRVAGAMIDIDDSAVAARDYWDFWAELDTIQYDTFQDYASLGNGVRPATYAEFWTDRINDGNNTADDGANGANYNNTIDYLFRDILVPNVPRTRPTNPEDAHRYRQRNDPATNPDAWTVVGIRPDTGDYDLRYYEDFAQTSLLASSAFGGTVMDFVAIDHNHRAESWDYPRVHLFSGSGNYGIEWATSTSTIADGTFAFNMSSSDVALVRDTAQSARVATYYRIVPGRGQNADMALMDSDPANSATWVQPRNSAVQVGSSGGAGVEEAFRFTASAADQLGFVLLNASGGGVVTLYRDTSAPTGSVAIDGGAADTSTTAVDLDIAAADAQTGIRDMRISVDGVFDSEPWQPFDASSSATLPAGDGLKTVSVQLRNRANMVRTVSDRIMLYTGVRCDGRIPTHVGTAAANTILGSNGPDVIIGLGGGDTLDGRDGNDVICGGGGNDDLFVAAAPTRSSATTATTTSPEDRALRTYAAAAPVTTTTSAGARWCSASRSSHDSGSSHEGADRARPVRSLRAMLTRDSPPRGAAAAAP